MYTPDSLVTEDNIDSLTGAALLRAPQHGRGNLYTQINEWSVPPSIAVNVYTECSMCRWYREASAGNIMNGWLSNLDYLWRKFTNHVTSKHIIGMDNARRT